MILNWKLNFVKLRFIFKINKKSKIKMIKDIIICNNYLIENINIL